MAVQLQRESTVYLFHGVTGDVPSVGAEVTYLTAGVRPQETDWYAAIIVQDSSHALWADAVASGVTGDYYIARLVGSYNANDLILGQGDYQAWMRLSGTDERPVEICPEAVEVQ